MSQKMYRVMQRGRRVNSPIPGVYAGSIHDKIFGRLDCPSGLAKMKSKNRVFFLGWDDAVEQGFRPCKVCKPDALRIGENLPFDHPALSARHVALWDTNPRPYPKRPQCCFYCAICWSEGVDLGRCVSHQVTLNDWTPYPQAVHQAVDWAKILGLSAIDSRNGVYRVLWVPSGLPTEEQLRTLRRLENSDDHIAFRCG